MPTLVPDARCVLSLQQGDDVRVNGCARTVPRLDTPLMSSAIISASKRLAIIASPRATAIMKGLLKSGRVEPGVVIGNFVKLPHTGHRESYFVRADGQLLHGVSLARAEELCESFGDYLARVGELAEEQPSTG